VAGTLHQLQKMPARFEYIVQNVFIEADVNFQGRETKIVFVVPRVPDAAFDLADRSERTKCP
jgi:hypothetical protein